MQVEGIVLRGGYKGLDISKVNFPPEVAAFVGGPEDPNRRPLGTAKLELRDDAIWATLTLPESEVKSFDSTPYFGVALANPEEDGSQDLAYLGLTEKNQDSDVPPATLS